MTTIAQKYRELLAMTQKHILDEYESKGWLPTDNETYFFYRNNYGKQSQHPAPKQPPAPKQLNNPPLQPPAAQKTTFPLQQPSVPREEQPSQKDKPIINAGVISTQSHSDMPPSKAERPACTTPQPPKELPRVAPPDSQSKESFNLEPLPPASSRNLASIQKLIQEHAPEISILETLEDSQAKQISLQRKKANLPLEVIILSFEEGAEEAIFLDNVAKAIDLCLAPAKVYSAQKIEQSQAWQQIFSAQELKLIITTDYGMYTLPGLMQHYRESPSKNQRYLGGIPILLLTHLKLYMQQPNLKQALWRAVTASLYTDRDSI